MTITASEMAKKRHKSQKKCPQCGGLFVAIAVKEYCSPRCKQAAYRERKQNTNLV